mmetsp:Transcript_28955/g.54788  ORF Transcript_28955/g.54788 Transcript_28955/m.54788 type:complete len:469 (+) Transcript_28955:229-1635(+)
MRFDSPPLLVILAFTTAASAFIAPPKPLHLTPPPIVPNRILQHRSTLTAATSPGSSAINNFLDAYDNDDHHQVAKKPRLSLALERTIQWVLKYLLVRQFSSIDVNIDAPSNRALLQGKLANLSISARDCTFRFNLLSFQRWDITGKNVRLGYTPLIVPCLPWIIWRLRGYIWFTMFSAQVLHFAGYLQSGSLLQKFRTSKERICHLLGARPSTINYSFSVAKDNVAQSSVLRFWLRSILRSLVDNSVVGAAAAVGDAFDVERKNQARLQTGAPLLPSSSKFSAGGGTENKYSLAPSSANSKASGSQSQQQGLTSSLLSATSFKLKNTSFSEGRVILEAEAVMPNEKNSSGRGALPFTIRAKLEPTSISDGDEKQQRRQKLQQQQQQEYNSIGFLTPECRLNTNPLTAGTLLGMLIPDVVWIPFGVGVAVPLGSGCHIYRAEITGGKDSNGAGICQIDGSLGVFQQRME